MSSRQLVSRARKHVTEGRRARVAPLEQRRLFDAFMGAAQQGSLEALEGVFATDVVSQSDGGGPVRAARRPVVGRARVAGFIAKVAEHHWSGVTVTRIEANGQACAVFSGGGTVGGLVTSSREPEGAAEAPARETSRSRCARGRSRLGFGAPW